MWRHNAQSAVARPGKGMEVALEANVESSPEQTSALAYRVAYTGPSCLAHKRRDVHPSAEASHRAFQGAEHYNKATLLVAKPAADMAASERRCNCASSTDPLAGHVAQEDTDHNLSLNTPARSGPAARHGVYSGMMLAVPAAGAACTGPGHPRTADPRENPPRFRLANDGAVAEPLQDDCCGEGDARPLFEKPDVAAVMICRGRVVN